MRTNRARDLSGSSHGGFFSSHRLHVQVRSSNADYNLDAGLGLFAGLNVLPKKSFATDYSYRTERQHQQQLLGSRVKKLSPILLPEAKAFSLDFHPIPYRGEEAVLENHYIPCRGQACRSVQSFFCPEHEKQMFCYANATLLRNEQAQEVLRFVDYWRDLTGRNPEWLYFDFKLTTYSELSALNARQIYFVTIRRRGTGILKRLEQRPASDWIPDTLAEAVPPRIRLPLTGPVHTAKCQSTRPRGNRR